MNRETSVEIGYYLKGKLIVSIWSDIFPNYNTGDSVELRTVPTNRDRMRRPAQEWAVKHYFVERVHHIVQQSRTDESLFTIRLEVYLNEPTMNVD
jgi:hypothetical protein